MQHGRDRGPGWHDNPAWDEALRKRDDIVFSGRESPTERASTGGLHRPGEIVVDTAQYEDPDDRNGVRRVLERVKADDQGDEVAARLGLRRLHVPEDVDLVGLVRRLRERSPGAAALNSVLVADPQRYGGCSPPRPEDPPRDVPGVGSEAKGRTIAVLDTGIADPPPFPVSARPEDSEVLDELPAGHPGPAVGHGTFVAGIVARYAPGAKILVRRVLNTPLGEADELQIAEALLGLEPVDIVNLSFGGFAVDDATMLVFERAVNQLPRTTLVVAAAGNQGVHRPHFSAAFKRVVAVGSAEGKEDSWRRADYSNYGGWVDCCAPGTDVHSAFIHFPGVDPGDPPLFEGGAICSGTSFAAPQVTAAAAVLAAREDIPARLAAHKLIHDDRRPVIDGVGTLVDPRDLP